MASPAAAPAPNRDRAFYLFTAIVSTAALGLIAWILLAHDGTADDGSDGGALAFMPAVNASFNAAAAVLLIAGWLAIRSGARRAHRVLMIGSFAMSSLFLVGYLSYHWVHGDTKFHGTGTIRTVYLSILASHVILSMFVVPGALLAFWFAWRADFGKHTRVTRILAPVWIYVSVTGVVVFFMLRA